jgi:hypothetical protein
MCGYFLRKPSEDVVADVVFSWDRPLSEVITEVPEASEARTELLDREF